MCLSLSLWLQCEEPHEAQDKKAVSEGWQGRGMVQSEAQPLTEAMKSNQRGLWARSVQVSD